MEGIFVRILSIGITASYLIVAVMVLRVLFSKAPKWIACFLWLLVGLRLICPFSIESSFSFIPQGAYGTVLGYIEKAANEDVNKTDGRTGQETGNGVYGIESGVGGTGNGSYKADDRSNGENGTGNGAYKAESPVNAAGSEVSGIWNGINKADTKTDKETGNGVYGAESGVSGTGNGIYKADEETHEPTESSGFIRSRVRILTLVWVIGFVSMLSYLFISYMLMRKKVAEATRLRENVWECEFVDSPFILGVMAPRIFVPYHMGEEKLVHVLAHENAHLKRKDHILKLAAFLILGVYWFSPLVWLSYILLCRDIELACDERVVKSMKQEEKTGYLLALLECSVSRGRTNVCPLAFGEIGIKERVIRVKKFKKPPVWLIIIVFIVCVTVSVGFLTSPKKAEDSQDKVYNRDAVAMPAGGEGMLNDDKILSEKEDYNEPADGQEDGQGDIYVGEDNYRELASGYRTKPSDNGEMSQYMQAALWFGFEGDEKGRFSFGYDPLSSYLPVGNYKIKDGKIICTTDNGLYRYVFKIEEDNTLVFMAEQSSKVNLIDENFGTEVTDGTVFYPEYEIEATEDVEVKNVDIAALDFGGDTGADGAQLYYADKDRIVFGGYFGLYVYDRGSGKIISSLDLKYIDCHYTQGDNYTQIAVSNDGKTVYLQPFAYSPEKSNNELYVFSIDENTLKKADYDRSRSIWRDTTLDLFWIEYDAYAKAEYERDGEERVGILYRNGFGTIGECGFVDYPKDGKGDVQYFPLFKPEGYETAQDFGAEDIHDIVELKMYADGEMRDIRDTDTLKKIEGYLSNAKKTKELELCEVPGSWPLFNNHPADGDSSCNFSTPIYLTRSDGVRGIIWPSQDECSGYISGKGFYEMDKGADRGLWHLLIVLSR